MLDALTEDWSRPYKIVRVLQALGMDVPQRLRRERLGLLIDALRRSGVEARLADGTAIDVTDSPGIEAKIRLRRTAGASPPGKEFGYDVVSRVPSGGMAECFKVKDADGVLRFLKKVRVAGIIQADALRRELAIYAKLERAHAANVLQIIDQKEEGDAIALIMELADGGTLEEHREASGELAPTEAKAIALAVAAGLSELHALDIVHRDLKPGNVLRSGGNWKLADFGISKNLGRLLTAGRTFQGYGTLGYTPPEQWEGREAHPSADIYALGKLIVWLLSGQTDVDHLNNHPRWAQLVRRCTDPDPNRRPALAEVLTALNAL